MSCLPTPRGDRIRGIAPSNFRGIAHWLSRRFLILARRPPPPSHLIRLQRASPASIGLVGYDDSAGQNREVNPMGTSLSSPRLSDDGEAVASKSEQYRRYALECLEIARSTHDERTQASLLQMAQVWLRLAQEAERAERDPSQPQDD